MDVDDCWGPRDPPKVDEVPGVLWKTEVILKGLFTKHHPLICPLFVAFLGGAVAFFWGGYPFISYDFLLVVSLDMFAFSYESFHLAFFAHSSAGRMP